MISENESGMVLNPWCVAAACHHDRDSDPSVNAVADAMARGAAYIVGTRRGVKHG